MHILTEPYFPKSYTNGSGLIKSITKNTYQWVATRATNVCSKRTIGTHEVNESTTSVTQVAHIHNMINDMMIIKDKVTKTRKLVNLSH